MATYEPPVDQLLRIGDDLWDRPKASHDYAGMGIGPEHIPELIRLAADPAFDDPGLDGPEIWAPIHAWRALGELRAEEAIPTLVGIVAAESEENYNDLVIEELPEVFAKIGPAAIPPLTALVDREDAGEYARQDAASILVAIAEAHPGERAGVVATIARVLERAEWHDPSFNGFTVSNLIDLEAKESAEVIKRAYDGGFVDESICGDWYDVWHRLALEGEPPPRPERPAMTAPDYDPIDDEFYEDFDLEPELSPQPSGWQPIEVKSPEERKERNKARQKLEQKVKGKGKGGKRR